MPGKSDAKIIADFVQEKFQETVAEKVGEAAVMFALDALGGCGAVTASYAVYQEVKVVRAAANLARWVADRMGKKHVRISRALLEEGFGALGL